MTCVCSRTSNLGTGENQCLKDPNMCGGFRSFQWLYHRAHGSFQLLLSHIEMKWCLKFTAQIILSFITQEYRYWAINFAGAQQDRCYIASPFYLPEPLGCSTLVAVHMIISPMLPSCNGKIPGIFFNNCFNHCCSSSTNP